MNFFDVRDSLLNCPALSGLDEKMKGLLLLRARPRTFTAGEVLFEKGQQADTTFFLITGGKLQLLSNRAGETIARLGPGELLGEIGLLDPSKKRSATVVAKEDSNVIEWDFHELGKDLQVMILPILERVAFDRIAGDLPSEG